MKNGGGLGRAAVIFLRLLPPVPAHFFCSLSLVRPPPLSESLEQATYRKGEHAGETFMAKFVWFNLALKTRGMNLRLGLYLNEQANPVPPGKQIEM